VTKPILLLAACALAQAAEQAVLSNGFRIDARSHEVDGNSVRLHTATGVIEIPLSAVTAFEEVEEPPPPTVAAPPPTANSPVARAAPATPRQLVDSAARKHGLPPAFLHSVAQAESAYRQDAVSPKGAIGIMQLMPSTAAELGADPRDASQNVEAGARHLADLLVRYQGSSAKALAAYNAGPGAVTKYGGVPPYTETRTYVRKVLENYQRMSESGGSNPPR
jgi:soluble lytic murein transglycosylase-like protein